MFSDGILHPYYSVPCCFKRKHETFNQEYPQRQPEPPEVTLGRLGGRGAHRHGAEEGAGRREQPSQLITPQALGRRSDGGHARAPSQAPGCPGPTRADVWPQDPPPHRTRTHSVPGSVGRRPTPRWPGPRSAVRGPRPPPPPRHRLTRSRAALSQWTSLAKHDSKLTSPRISTPDNHTVVITSATPIPFMFNSLQKRGCKAQGPWSTGPGRCTGHAHGGGPNPSSDPSAGEVSPPRRPGQVAASQGASLRGAATE